MLDKVNQQVKNLEGNVEKLDRQNKVLTEKVNLASTFVASEISLMPVQLKNDKEQETFVAKKASKFVITFAVKNNITDYESADIYLVITEPNGTIMRNEDAWESNVTTFPNGNKLTYTRRVKFEYHKGETKRMLLSLNPDDFYSGTYAMQLYHNGNMIGQVMKSLK